MSAQRIYNAAVDFVDRHLVEGRGAKTAFIDPYRNITYAELGAAAARVGPMLPGFGVEPENSIATVMLDTVDLPILSMGSDSRRGYSGPAQYAADGRAIS